MPSVYPPDPGAGGVAGVYLLLRFLVPPAWAAVGTLLALLIGVFSGTSILWPLWRFPSSTVIRRHATLIDPAEFQQITIDVRHATATGWVRLMGSASSARVLPFNRSA